MIRYALLCRQDHGFEAWFRDSEAFDRQSHAGQVICPACGTSDVRKALMAPSIRRSRGAPASPPPPQPETTEAEVAAAPQTPPAVTPPSPVPPTLGPLADEQFGKVRAAVRELHARLKQNAENVGASFPDQARRIHEGDAPPRAIYGTATNDEVRSLVEDGVGIMPIPSLPDDRN